MDFVWATIYDKNQHVICLQILWNIFKEKKVWFEEILKINSVILDYGGGASRLRFFL